MLSGHTDSVQGCAVSPDGVLLATASFDGVARLWHLADGTERARLRGHADGINSCAISPDGTLLATASDDRTARLWQLPDGHDQAVLTGHATGVFACAFSPNSALLATSSTDGTVRLWHVASGGCHCALRVGTSVIGIAWHPDGTMLCAVGGAGVYMLDYLP